MLRKILIIIFAIALLAGVFIVKTLYDAGEFKTISPHFSGTKHLMPHCIGAEDITIDHEKQVAYISADDRFATLHGKEGTGNIYVLDLKTADAIPVAMNLNLPYPIHPHGISLFKKDSIAYLYAINHTDARHSILLFKGDKFELENTFTDSAFMISPNDIVAVDENRFYFTNDHGSRSAFGKKMENYLQLKRSNVVYYDGENYSVAAEGIAYANGINMSRDRKELYVASIIGGCVLVYNRDTATGKLTKKEEVHIGSGPDNIEVDESGNLWVACHPQLLTFVNHANDTSKHAPSQVFKLTKNDAAHFTPREIFLSNGDDLSGSSVAAVTGKLMLIGSVMDKGILRCERK